MTKTIFPDVACGRDDGSLQRWNTDGEMSEDVWMGHSKGVRSVLWSPSGGHIASRSDDGTIQIRKADSGKVEVGPIEMKQDWVCSLQVGRSIVCTRWKGMGRWYIV